MLFTESLKSKIASSHIAYPDIFKKMPADMANYMDFFNLPYDQANYEGGFLSFGQQKIFVQSFSIDEPEKVAFLFHGLFDHGAYFASVIPLLMRLGYKVIVWDQLGFGLSSGERTYCSSFSDYVNVADAVLKKFANEGEQPRLFIGHSAGCAQILELIQRQKISQNDRIIFLCPLIRCAKWKLVKMMYRYAGSVLKRVPRRFSQSSGDPAFLQKLKTDPLEERSLSTHWVGSMIKWEKSLETFATPIVPLLTIQGDQDHTVDWSYNLSWLEAKFLNFHKKVVVGGHHHIHNDSSAFQTECLAAIESFVVRS